MARMSDVLWRADADGAVTSVTPCRPTLPSGDGELDQTEVHRVEQLWRRCVRCAERFSAVYHVRTPGSSPRTLLIQAMPVLDDRDEVLYWSGSAAEVDRFSDSGTRFISEAGSVLSSSLNRATLVNRFLETSVDHFCDLCALHAFEDDGSTRLEGVADRQPELGVRSDVLDAGVEEVVRTRQPLLLLSAALQEPIAEKMQYLLRAANARSMIVVPLFVAKSCIGTLSFLESERPASFAARDVDVAVVVGRQLAMALENIKTFEREQQVTERFRFLARVTECLFATLDPVKMFELLLQALGEEFADYGMAASLVDGELRSVASVGTKARLRDTTEREMVAALRERRSILAGSVPDVGRGVG